MIKKSILVSNKTLTFSLFVGCFYRKGPALKRDVIVGGPKKILASVHMHKEPLIRNINGVGIRLKIRLLLQAARTFMSHRK